MPESASWVGGGGDEIPKKIKNQDQNKNPKQKFLKKIKKKILKKSKKSKKTKKSKKNLEGG